MSKSHSARGAARERHRSDLVQARLKALVRMQRRARWAAVLFVLVVAALVVSTALQSDRAQANSDTPLGSAQSPFQELWVSGAIHVVDERGRDLAVLGREQREGPIVLGLYPPSANGGLQTLRLATSETGAALSIRTASGDSAVTMLAQQDGPELELKRGSIRRVLSEHEPAPPPSRGRLTLPAVGAARSARIPLLELDAKRVQDIGDGFLVANLSAEERPDGVLVTGRIVNATSVKHRKVRFRVSLGNGSQTFEINLISPGNSTGFLTSLPGIDLASVSAARIEYLNSTVTYFGHSLRGRDGYLSARAE